MQSLTRRQLVGFGFCAAVSAAFPSVALASTPAKKLSFLNLHTGERLRVTYSERGRYVPSALKELDHFLRDFRTNDVSKIDPQLFDQLHMLQRKTEAAGEFHVISGYRSPHTNHMLHERSGGVANRSLHMEGRAIDINLQGSDLSTLRQAALDMQAGGVGYYPSSGFIHLDTGRVRQWAQS